MSTPELFGKRHLTSHALFDYDGMSTLEDHCSIKMSFSTTSFYLVALDLVQLTFHCQPSKVKAPWICCSYSPRPSALVFDKRLMNVVSRWRLQRPGKMLSAPPKSCRNLC